MGPVAVRGEAAGSETVSPDTAASPPPLDVSAKRAATNRAADEFFADQDVKRCRFELLIRDEATGAYKHLETLRPPVDPSILRACVGKLVGPGRWQMRVRKYYGTSTEIAAQLALVVDVPKGVKRQRVPRSLEGRHDLAPPPEVSAPRGTSALEHRMERVEMLLAQLAQGGAVAPAAAAAVAPSVWERALATALPDLLKMFMRPQPAPAVADQFAAIRPLLDRAYAQGLATGRLEGQLEASPGPDDGPAPAPVVPQGFDVNGLLRELMNGPGRELVMGLVRNMVAPQAPSGEPSGE